MRILALSILFVGLTAAAATAAVSPFNTGQFYTEVEFRAAVAPYTAAVAANANDADAHYWLGVAYLHAAKQFRFGLSPWAGGALAQSVQSLERAVALRAGPRELATLSEAYFMAGQQAKALALLDRLGALAAPLPLK